MAALPPIADFTASTTTEGGFKTAMSGLRDFLNGLFGSTGTPATARLALGVLADVAEVSVASATTTDIGAAASSSVLITGSTTITSLGTVAAGTVKTLRFSSTPILTHNATTLILPSAANITATAGDCAQFESLGSGNWVCRFYQRNSGSSLVAPIALTSSATVASTSGTSIDFTGIPAGTKRVTINFLNVSTNGSGNVRLQIGSGSFDTTGYTSASAQIINASVGTSSATAGIDIFDSSNAIGSRNGTVVMTLIGTNTWVFSSVIGDAGLSYIFTTAGSKSLSGSLDRVRVTTSFGTDTFDAGSINIMYE